MATVTSHCDAVSNLFADREWHSELAEGSLRRAKRPKPAGRIKKRFRKDILESYFSECRPASTASFLGDSPFTGHLNGVDSSKREQFNESVDPVQSLGLERWRLSSSTTELNMKHLPVLSVVAAIFLCNTGLRQVAAQSPPQPPPEAIAALERAIESNRRRGVTTKSATYYHLASAYRQARRGPAGHCSRA